MFVSIKIKLDKEGNVIYSKLINDNKLNESFFRAAAESALRAVRRCDPIKVPDIERYENWKDLQLNFDPREILRG